MNEFAGLMSKEDVHNLQHLSVSLKTREKEWANLKNTLAAQIRTSINTHKRLERELKEVEQLIKICSTCLGEVKNDPTSR